jgi:Flp pilus assembly pilin Flp
MISRVTKRFANSRGVTVVEYALGIAMLAIPITIGVTNLEDSQGSHLQEEGQRIGNPDGAVLGYVATTLAPVSTTAATATSSSTTGSTTTSTTTTVVSSTTTAAQSTTTYATVGTAHLAAMTGAGKTQANPSRWTATVIITVRDGDGELVAGAEVTGEWNPTGNNTPTCTTEANGQCTVSQVDMKRSGGDAVYSATFTMSGLTHPELTYAPADNQGPLSVTILKP